MDLPYTINFRLTSLFLAAFTWEICSFIFVLLIGVLTGILPKKNLTTTKFSWQVHLPWNIWRVYVNCFGFFFWGDLGKQFHSYNLIWQRKSFSVNTGKAKKRTVVSQKSNWNYSSNERNLKISLNKKTKNSTIISLALKACRQMQGSISWEVLIQSICTFIKLNQIWQLNFCFL